MASRSLSRHSAHFIPELVVAPVDVGLSGETRRSSCLPDFRCCSNTGANKAISSVGKGESV